MSDTRHVAFQNRRGDLLHGILHEPAPSVARGVCVLLLSPGIKGRVGPHRLYLKIAAALVPLGFHVLRFDFHGLGDSEGELTEHELVDVYNRVHGGCYVDDTIDAVNWLQRASGVSRFVGSGLCGGSITALMAAEIDRRIECILGIGLPTMLDGGPENWARYVSSAQASALRTGYLRKLANPRSLLRFVTGKSGYGAILRVFGYRASDDSGGNAALVCENSTPDRTNPRFDGAFFAMLDSNRPMMLIFSGNDRLAAQFADGFERRCTDRIRPNRHLYEVQVIANANHVLSDRGSVDELVRIGGDWLTTLFPKRV